MNLLSCTIAFSLTFVRLTQDCDEIAKVWMRMNAVEVRLRANVISYHNYVYHLSQKETLNRRMSKLYLFKLVMIEN